MTVLESRSVMIKWYPTRRWLEWWGRPLLVTAGLVSLGRDVAVMRPLGAED